MPGLQQSSRKTILFVGQLQDSAPFQFQTRFYWTPETGCETGVPLRNGTGLDKTEHVYMGFLSAVLGEDEVAQGIN